MAISRRDALGLSAVATATAIGLSGYNSLASNAPNAEIEAAVEGLRQALIRADGAALNTYMHPSLSFGHSDGLIQTREEFVRAIASGSEVFNSLKLTQHDNRVVGDMAIARHRFVADVTIQGKDLSVDLGELQVWRRTEGLWRLFARQAFAV